MGGRGAGILALGWPRSQASPEGVGRHPKLHLRALHLLKGSGLTLAGPAPERGHASRVLGTNTRYCASRVFVPRKLSRRLTAPGTRILPKPLHLHGLSVTLGHTCAEVEQVTGH